MLTTRITVKVLRELADGGRVEDSEIRALQAWKCAGRVSFRFYRMHGGVHYRKVIGHWPGMTIDEARGRCLSLLGSLENHGGLDEPSRAVVTVGDAVEAYVKASHDRQARQYCDRFSHLFPLPQEAVDKSMLLDVHKEMRDRPYSANRGVLVFAAAVNRARRSTDMPHMSLAGFPFYPETPRTRFLSKTEAPRFIEALRRLSRTVRNGAQADALLMMLFTGQRKTNVLRMRIEDVDGFDVWTIPKEEFKARREHSVKLGEAEMEIFRREAKGRKSGFVFRDANGEPFRYIERTFAAACRMAGVRGLRIHDLRRTIGTWMLSSGAPVAVVAKKLGHNTIATTERVYAHILSDVTEAATNTAIHLMMGGK